MSDYNPMIYVADLAAYVEGRLRGQWFEVLKYADADDLRQSIDTFIKDRASAEEWAIHDTDDFDTINIGEYESLETVFMHAQMLATHGDAWVAYVDYFSPDPSDDFETDFLDRYQGEYDSGEEFAQGYFEDMYGDDLGVGDDLLRGNIDWAGVWRDLDLGGDYVMSNGHVFSGS